VQFSDVRSPSRQLIADLQVSDKGAVIRPLLKWAGGKRQLLPALQLYYPGNFTRYMEPFLGSGAVFFDLFNTGRLDGRQAWLVDINPDLIGCYRTVRDRVDDVIAVLKRLERSHYAEGNACYYDVRDRFNSMRARPSTTSALEATRDSEYSAELAAMFIYLNRTGFNGLFRLNREGGFNVPAGRYVNPTICDAEHLRSVARALSAAGVVLECLGFEQVLAAAEDGDFVYCDPPYAPVSRTASFAHYTAGGFTLFDQARLQRAVVAAVERGATVLLSNSTAHDVETLYASRAARDAGLVTLRVPARRAINSRASARGAVDELIITNAHSARAAARIAARKKMAKAALRSGDAEVAAAGTRKRRA